MYLFVLNQVLIQKSFPKRIKILHPEYSTETFIAEDSDNLYQHRKTGLFWTNFLFDLEFLIFNFIFLYLRGVNEAHDEPYRLWFQLFITVRTNGIYNASICNNANFN